MGFTFDDTSDEATPIATMEQLIAENPHYKEVIFPYIGGSEVNSSPTHAHHRYVINFGEMSEDEARKKYPDLMAIVEEKVKPDRNKLASKGSSTQKKRAKYWWQFGGGSNPGLRNAIADLDRVLVISRVTEHCVFTFLNSGIVYSERLAVFSSERDYFFSIIQSRFHEIWAKFFGSSLEDRFMYAPVDCFETFPFPKNWETNSDLETIGEEYYQYRAELMVKNNQGLTDTYNRFHDPDERHPDIEKLRALHQQMDIAVLKAYGWEDLTLTCGFDLDYFDLEPENLPPDLQARIDNNNFFFETAHSASVFQSYVKTGKKSLPWRYRWPQELHDEILARLLELNAKRHEQELLLGTKASSKKPKKPVPKTEKGQGELF